MNTRALRAAVAVILTIFASVVTPRPAMAQWAVIDVSNLAQNILQAARMLQQINNQIQSLQNQATMLQNMGKNLSSLNFSSLSAMTSDLQRIGTLMNEAQGISFNVQSVQTAYQQRIDRVLAEQGDDGFAAAFLADVGLDWAADLLRGFPSVSGVLS